MNCNYNNISIIKSNFKKEFREHSKEMTFFKMKQKINASEKLQSMNFPMEVIKDLQLDIINNRTIKRKIALKKHVKWEVYQLAFTEIQRRITNDLNLESGKIDE